MIIRRRFLTVLASGVFALSALSACGSVPSATDAPQSGPIATQEQPATESSSSALPLYPAAKPFDKSSPMASAVDAMKQQMAQQQANANVDIYELPSGAKFEQVKSFYGDALGKQGYSEMTTGQQAQLPQGGGMAVWAKGSDTAVSVMVMDNPMGGAILIIGQGKGK